MTGPNDCGRTVIMEDKSATVLAILILFFVLTYVSVGLRTFTRLRIKNAFGADDATIIVLLVEKQSEQIKRQKLTFA